MNFLGLGTPEIILILVIVLLFFGKEKLPELARSIGNSLKELKSGFGNLDGQTEEKKSDDANKQSGSGEKHS